ncbi:bifunctional riboflavin kinase/FAD synthetase [Accumulibacter sp.]|uniref:bifunctional riboflavin kinase/FAD synthetase n=1 Tax=Accumulibacter sp. TaxID=2053492 RepID=UPI002604AD6B|nr:bifunctional riboflavin kinase/FAD synthetase [Accumulibacter sp.]
MLVYRGYSQTAHRATVLTIGNFDGVHIGHRALLARLTRTAASVGLPSAVLTFEPHPREFFAPQAAPPRLSTLREKLELVADDGVDVAYVCRFNAAFASMSADQFIERVLVGGLRARHLIVGDDFRFGARRAGDFARLRAAGAHFGFVVEALESIILDGVRASSSAVREALQAGRLEQAATLLGRPYSIDGRVVRGEQLGRQLGFATANIRIKHDRPPLLGVFAVEVKGLPGGPHRGAANLGYRPTAGQEARPLLEVHLFDFAADIYGAHLNVRFLHKLRDEMKFADLAALKTRIALDVAAAKAYFQS